MINSGLLGQNISYSQSPGLFQSFFMRHSMNGQYHLFDLPFEQVESFIAKVKNDPDFIGLNITVPFKEKIIPFLDMLDIPAKNIGAVNCIYKNAGNLIGTNTDYQAFLNPLIPHLEQISSVLVIGIGGAAKAVHYALKKADIDNIYFWARNEDKLHYFISKKGGEVWRGKSVDMIVNCTPIGTSGNQDEHSTKICKSVEKCQFVYDLVYSPSKTRLLDIADANGIVNMNGAAMLVNQASLSAQYWFGKKFDDDFIEKMVEQIDKKNER